MRPRLGDHQTKCGGGAEGCPWGGDSCLPGGHPGVGYPGGGGPTAGLLVFPVCRSRAVLGGHHPGGHRVPGGLPLRRARPVSGGWACGRFGGRGRQSGPVRRGACWLGRALPWGRLPLHRWEVRRGGGAIEQGAALDVGAGPLGPGVGPGVPGGPLGLRPVRGVRPRQLPASPGRK